MTFGVGFGYNLVMESPFCKMAMARIARPATFLMLAGLAAAGCSQSAAPLATMSQTSAGINATMTTAEAPHTGDDVLVVTLHDTATGASIGDANVSGVAEAQSPRLPGQSVTGRAQGNGVYDIPVTLPVISGYKVVVTAERPTHPTATFTFSVDVPK